LSVDDVTAGTLPGFAAATKTTDARYAWFVRQYGTQCWEVDALSPPVLRARVEAALRAEIDHDAWRRCAVTERAEEQSMRAFFQTWPGIKGQVPE
jgi:hypothetical protein